MPPYYVKRVLQLLQEEGILKTSIKIKDHILWCKISPKNRRFYLRTRKNTVINKFKFDAVANPWTPIWISPEKIKYNNNSVYTSVYGGKQLYGLGQIRGGDWDLEKSNWRENITYTGLKQRFVEGCNWEETDYVRWHEKKIQTEGKSYGYQNINHFINGRCSYLDDLYEGMKDKGYQLNHEPNERENNIERGNPQNINWNDKYEPFILIDRNGKLQGTEGTHRRAIAEFIGIEKIPVNVLVRHRQWQDLRDNIYNNGLSGVHDKKLSHHPDLKDILE